MNEKKVWYMNGFLGVFLIAVLIIGGVILLMNQQIVLGLLSIVAGGVLASGVTVIQPNRAAVVTFFGRYIGSIRDSGLFLTMPLTVRQKVTLRVRNFNSKQLKVNDVEGNPIEIAAVVVYKVVDSAKASFNVDDYEEFVAIQSEAGIRHIASMYPYDNFKEEGLSLRENTDEVTVQLAAELQERLALAGVEVLEARLTHLAYSTEIAQAMLQRQQASAIIAARKMLVEGAVGMAQMAIDSLDKENVLELDDERKVQLVNNLMVAIVSDRGAQPVINSGSLY